MSISHICWRNALKGLAVAVPLLVVSGFFVAGSVKAAVMSFQTVGGGTAAATTNEAYSGNESAELQVVDGTVDMAVVSIPVDIALDQITSLKFWQKLQTGSAAFGANIILGVDSDGDGNYEADDISWHIGTPHVASALGGDTFISMDGVSVSDTWASVDAMSVSQWWTPNAAGDGLSNDCYTFLGTFFTSCSDMKPELDVTDHVKVIKLVIGGSSSWNDISVFVDSLELNGNVLMSAPVTNGDQGFNTIQAAIDDATSGDTVNVAAGTYGENLIIDKSLTLSGDRGDTNVAGPGVDAPFLDGSSLSGVSAIRINTGVSNVTIEGFEIGNYGPIGNTEADAINAWNSQTSNITVQDNDFHDLGWNGILVGSDDDTVQSEWTIKNNTVANAAYAGIELTNVTNSQVLDNEIIGPASIANDPGDAGVGIEIATRARVGTLVAGTGITVSGNEITGVFAAGSRTAINLLSRAYDSGNSNATLSGVTVSENIITGSGTRGIYVVAESRGSKPSEVENLTLELNTLNGNSVGIEFGIETPVPAPWFGENGTYDTNTITIEKNKIDGNTDGLTNTTITTVTATNNWWGDASGPNHATNLDATGDAVSDNVTFLPWCSSAVCTSTLGGLTLSPTEPTILTNVGGEIENTFTPEQGLIVNSDSDVYLGLNAVSSLDMPVHNIVWKFVIDGPGTLALSSSMVDVQEVGWFDADECGIIDSVTSTCPNTAGDSYTFIAEGDNLVAYGSGGTFDSDPNDEFVTVSRLHLNPSAPLGNYKITATIVGNNVTVDDTTDAVPFDSVLAVNISNGITRNFALVPSTVSTVVMEAIPANTPTEVDASSTLNTTLKFTASSTIDIAVASVGQRASAPGTTLALNKFLTITADDESSIENVEIRVYYTDTEVETTGIIESELRLWFYDEDASQWALAPGSGVNTNENYVFATVNHLSTWGVFGARVVVANTGGGGGGGGGGGAPAPAVTTPAVIAAAAAPTPILTPRPAGEVLGAATFRFAQTLRFGATGDAVTELQNRLTSEGVYTGPITGYFGPLTEKGVKAFQEKYGIEQVGIVGPLTRAKLNASGETAAAPAAGQVLGAATAMTPEQLQAKIAEIQAQINVLLQQVTEALRQLNR